MGTLTNAIRTLFGWQPRGSYNQIVNANKVVFSSFGKDFTASDMVKTAIHRVAEEISKCTIKSVIETQSPAALL